MGRVIPGVGMAVGLLLLLFFGSFPLFWAVLVCTAVLALHEYFRMTLPALGKGLRIATIGVAILPVAFSLFGSAYPVMAGLAGGLIATASMVLLAYDSLEDVLTYLCRTGFGIVYIPFCMAHLALIRTLPDGVLWLTVLVAMISGSDTGAYYAGKNFGRKKLFPVISPKKTIAGGVGGIVTGVCAAQIAALILSLETNFAILFLCTVLLVIIGIVGDLTESMIKRSVGVKDSGQLLGGHGGLLDRLDSLLLTAPLLFYLLQFGIL